MAFWASFIVAVLILGAVQLFLKQDKIRPDKQVGLIASLNLLRHTKHAYKTLLITLAWMTGFYAVYTFLGTFLAGQFKLNTATLGEVFVAYGLSNFIASFFGGNVLTKLGAKKNIIVNGILSVLMILGLAVFNQQLSSVIIFLIVLAFAQGFDVTALTTYIVNVIPDNRATMMSFNSSFIYLGLTIGSLAGSLIYGVSSSYAVICFFAASGILLAIWLAGSIKQFK